MEAVSSGTGSPGIENEMEWLGLRAEIDAIVARDVFRLTATEMEFVLKDFSTVASRQIRRHREFLTKRLILEAMARK